MKSFQNSYLYYIRHLLNSNLDKMLRAIVIGISAFILSFSLPAQVGVHTVYMRHNGTAAMVFDAPLGIGLHVHGKWKNSCRIGADFTQYRLNARRESFPMINTDLYSVVFGKQSYSNYKLTTLSGCYDFAFLEQYTYGVFIGTEAILGVFAGDRTFIWPYSEPHTVRDNGAFIGVNYRLGGFYDVHKRIRLNLSTSFGIYKFPEFGVSLHNTIRFGIDFLLQRNP